MTGKAHPLHIINKSPFLEKSTIKKKKTDDTSIMTPSEDSIKMGKASKSKSTKLATNPILEADEFSRSERKSKTPAPKITVPTTQFDVV